VTEQTHTAHKRFASYSLLCPNACAHTHTHRGLARDGGGGGEGAEQELHKIV